MTTLYLQDSAVVDTLIANTGGRVDTQDITLEYDDGGTPQQADSVPGLTLQPGGDVTRALVHSPADTETGTWTLTVASDDDTATASVDVLKPFDVTITGVSPSNPDPGETTAVTIDVTNVSSTARTVELTLDVDGTTEDRLVLAGIGGGATATVTLSWTPQSDGGKTVTATAVAASDSTTVTVSSGTYPAAAIHAYDATEISGLSDGNTVSTWTDQVGSADGSALGSPTYRASQINSKASIELDGSNDAFATGYFPDTGNNLTAIAVVEMTAGTTGSAFGQLNSNVENRGPSVRIRDDNVNDYNPAYGDGATTGGTNNAGNPVLLTLEGDSGTATFRQDGSQLFSFSYTGGQTPQDGDMHLGARDRPDQGTVDNFFDGYLAEIVFYDGLSSSERDNEESRLASKWGITI